MRAIRAVDPVEAIFRALSDPTRRRIVERLSSFWALSVTKLAQPFDIAVPTLVRHLDVLEDAGLVRSLKLGRVRYYRLMAHQLGAGERWLARRRETWEGNFKRPVVLEPPSHHRDGRTSTGFSR
jgi:DNA-binding transcriptional ArsR family regulator